MAVTKGAVLRIGVCISALCVLGDNCHTDITGGANVNNNDIFFFFFVKRLQASKAAFK